MKIKTKEEFYKRFQTGQFGNMTRAWMLREFFPQFPMTLSIPSYEINKKVAVRVLRKDNPYMKYDLNRIEAFNYCQWLCKSQGLQSDEIQISELAPDHLNTLQGHIMRSSDYILFEGLNYDIWRPKKIMRMRRTMEYVFNDQGHRFIGLRALELLRQKMDATSFDFLNEIWDMFPTSIIEFACYEIGVGTLGWNTIFWEVRDY